MNDIYTTLRSHRLYAIKQLADIYRKSTKGGIKNGMEVDLWFAKTKTDDRKVPYKMKKTFKQKRS